MTSLLPNITVLSVSDAANKIVRSPPTPVPSDYILVALLVILFLVGSPVNLVAFAHLHQNNGKRGLLAAYFAKSPLHLLKIHLNLTDLMVLFVYTTCKICWLITYQWRGGRLLCKLMQFANSTSFQISSNIVICIAFDRVLVVLYKRRTPEVCRAVRQSIGLAWISALLFNIPQFFIWTVITPYPAHPSWQQCVTVGFSDRLQSRSSITNEQQQNSTMSKSLATVFEEAYNLFHLIVIFWLPLTIIALCYIVVAYSLNRLSTNQETYKTNSNGITTKCDPHLPLHHYFNRQQRSSKKSACGYNSSSDYCTASQITTDDANDDTPDRRFSAATDVSSTAALIVSKELRLAKRKTVRTNLLLVIAYVLCWLPYNVLTFWHLVDPAGFKPFENSVRFAYHMIVLNSVINPFLYSMINVNFKEGSPSRLV